MKAENIQFKRSGLLKALDRIADTAWLMMVVCVACMICMVLGSFAVMFDMGRVCRPW